AGRAPACSPRSRSARAATRRAPSGTRSGARTTRRGGTSPCARGPRPRRSCRAAPARGPETGASERAACPACRPTTDLRTRPDRCRARRTRRGSRRCCLRARTAAALRSCRAPARRTRRRARAPRAVRPGASTSHRRRGGYARARSRDRRGASRPRAPRRTSDPDACGRKAWGGPRTYAESPFGSRAGRARRPRLSLWRGHARAGFPRDRARDAKMKWYAYAMGTRLIVVVAPFIAVVAAGALALLRAGSPSSAAEGTVSPEVRATPEGVEAERALDPQGGALPPGHPPVGGMNAQQGPASADDAPGLRWTMPAGWQAAPNPSPMRLATYHVPGPSGGALDAEMSVARAGGTTEANIQRWVGQFDDAGPDEQTEKTVRGLHVTTVEVTGTYLGAGMGAGAASAPRPKGSLLAAIVEPPGSPYFFKLVGPAATVRAGRAAFDGLVGSFTPL